MPLAGERWYRYSLNKQTHTIRGVYFSCKYTLFNCIQELDKLIHPHQSLTSQHWGDTKSYLLEYFIDMSKILSVVRALYFMMRNVLRFLMYKICNTPFLFNVLDWQLLLNSCLYSSWTAATRLRNVQIFWSQCASKSLCLIYLCIWHPEFLKTPQESLLKNNWQHPN